MGRYAGSYDFTFVHLIRPHPPGYPVAVVRRERPTVTLDEYLNRLREADTYLGELLDALRKSHGDFALIVTADHGLRYSSWKTMGYRFEGFGQRPERAPADTFRVPLMIHLSSSARGSQTAIPVSTLQLRSLIPRVMRGELKTESDIVAQLTSQPFDPEVLSLGQSFEKSGPMRVR
jgi:membrane-anchored protein YejM (alkaline phosphatase superfamily)